MERHILFLLGLSVLLLSGCQSKSQQPAMHQEEPYTPGYTTLETMDAAPASDTATTYEPPPAETTMLDSTGGTSDEILAPVGGRVYIVQKGDTLFKLARRFYNDQARWRDIWEANKTRVPDPDKLQSGMKLIIP